MPGRLHSLRQRADVGLHRAWHRGLALRARDWTQETARRSCLVLAAHPDDETFACGATIVRKTETGTPVKILIATDGRNANPSSAVLTPEQLGAVRRAESEEVCGLLGVTGADRIQLEHENLRSPERLADVRRRVEAVIDAFEPDEILVNSAHDYHPDHRLMHALARELVDSGRYRGRVAEYPIWYLFDGPWASTAEALSERPTVDQADRAAGEAPPRSRLRRTWDWVAAPVASVARLRTAKVVTAPYLDRKKAAIAAYPSQVTNYTGEESWGYLHDNFVSVFLQPEEIFFPWRE
jgi:LmbE family N-acetylglucosaminyl deacetylase